MSAPFGTIAIVGLEIDQVRKTPRGDVSVPINVAYNHHHDTAVVGKGTRLVEVERAPKLSPGVAEHRVQVLEKLREETAQLESGACEGGPRGAGRCHLGGEDACLRGKQARRQGQTAREKAGPSGV